MRPRGPNVPLYRDFRVAVVLSEAPGGGQRVRGNDIISDGRGGPARKEARRRTVSGNHASTLGQALWQPFSARRQVYFPNGNIGFRTGPGKPDGANWALGPLGFTVSPALWCIARRRPHRRKTMSLSNGKARLPARRCAHRYEIERGVVLGQIERLGDVLIAEGTDGDGGKVQRDGL